MTQLNAVIDALRAAVYAGTTEVGAAIDAGEITMTKGDPAAFIDLWSMFDPLCVERDTAF